MSKATIDDVAGLAGVSIKTVSRVVNDEPNVRETTRERVQSAIAKLNYRPNISARNLASHRSHLIIMVYDDPAAYETPSAGYVIRMQEGALRACRRANCELLIQPCNYRNSGVRQELTNLIERTRPDGVIIAAPLSNMSGIVGAIKGTGVPYVRLSTGTRSAREFSVATNDREASAEMTRYLASLGHERIAFISGHDKHKAVVNRELGYRDGLEQSGLPFRKTLLTDGDNSIGSGEAAAEALLTAKGPRPTAIFAANDDMAAGVVRVAYRLGIDVPEQLSIAGFDDSSLARQIYPALTTVWQPLEEMANRATDGLINGLQDGAESRTLETVPARLQIRASTGPAPQPS